jgi:eukaryotic-like serine/threonine-protein kinase
VIAPEIKPEIEKYELLEEIGHGGMATVYRASDRRLGREVAVKVIHRHLRENAEVAARFVSEARAVAKMRHPNIVEVYDVSDEDDPERYLVVELVRGTTLRRLLNERGVVPAEVAAMLGVFIASGLDHAHKQGVIHRDVKPENVLVGHPVRGDSSPEATRGAQARVKITDFGIAKLLDAQGVTSTGQVLGSPAHMAPEQIEGGDVGPTADVFALGVLLYEVMVGKLPFEGKNPAQVLRRVLEGHFVPPERARPSVGPEFSRIVARALAHKPEERYAAAEELAEELRAELGRLGFGDIESELPRYFADPAGYEASYSERIVARLIELGNEAREQRNLPAAAACFNRALAVRPDDPELVREVAGLARSERVRRNLGTAAVATVVALVLGLVGFGIYRFVDFGKMPNAKPTVSIKREAPIKRERNTSRSASSAGPAVTAVRVVPVGSRKPATSKTPQTTRMVRITVDGPKSARVRVDGVEFSNYLEERLELPVGVHQFEFMPPPENPSCCKGPSQRSVEIVPGEGDQTVQGTIRFRDALIEFNAPPGWEATCGVFGQFKTRGPHSIPMTQARRSDDCFLLPPTGSPEKPQSIHVSLTPGESVVLNAQ